MIPSSARRKERKENKLRAAFFWIGVAVAQTIAILVLPPLMIYWATSAMSHSPNSTEAAGLEAVWSGGPPTFNWHPLLMSFAFVVVQTQALLTYRFYSRAFKQLTKKSRLKTLHAALHSLTFVLMAVGLAAAFDAHESGKRFSGHLTTLHSWFGLMTAISFIGQLTFGVVVYLVPDVFTERQRRISIHYHRLLGLGLYGLACATIATGAVSLLDNDEATYPDRTEAVVGQFAILFLPFLVVTIVFLLTKSDYRRRRDPEETQLTMKTSQYTNLDNESPESKPLTSDSHGP